MTGWREVWHFDFLGNELGAWTLAFVTLLVTFTALPLAKRFISVRRRRLIGPGPPRVHLAIDLTALLVERTKAVFLLFWMQAARWAMAAVRYAIDVRRQRSSGPDTLLQSSMAVILFLAGLVIWGVSALLALGNLGVKIEPLLEGQGIRGIALALAVQTVLADLLASLSIALDKPFGLGDFLAVDTWQGTVEHIGVKSTRLRSLSGEQIIIANVDLLKARVRNFGRMSERRAVFQLGVDYDVPVATLAAVPRAVREIIEATPDTRFERCHLLSCGERALQFEIVYVLANPDFNLYADAQQRINLRILERFRALEVSFAAAVPTGVRLYGPPSPAPEAGGQQRLL